MTEPMTQAAFVASRFPGGYREIAEALHLAGFFGDITMDASRQRVYRLIKTGWLPPETYEHLLRHAQVHGYDLNAFDFVQHLVTLADAA